MKSMNQKSILPLIIFCFFCINATFSQVKTYNDNELLVNYADLCYFNGLYYLQGELYSGYFYNSYSSEGLNGSSKDSYSTGEIKQGKREGKWKWYLDNVLVNSTEYKDGDDINSFQNAKYFRDNDGRIYQLINGEKLYQF